MNRKTMAKRSRQEPGYRPAAQTRASPPHQARSGLDGDPGVWAYVGADASSARPSASSSEGGSTSNRPDGDASFCQRPTTNDQRLSTNQNCASNFARAVPCQSFLIFVLQLIRQLEVHQNLGLDLYRFPVQVVRLVLPLPHGFLRGVRQDAITADHLQILNVTVLGDSRLQLHWALDTHLQRLRRVPGLDSFQ